MKKLSEWPKDKKIVAIDFDGTITLGDQRRWKKNEYVNDILLPRKEIIEWILDNRDKMYLILWTCRTGKALQDAIDFSLAQGITFDTINDNIMDFECSNKVMADYYIDDKAIDIKEVFNDR